MADAATSRDAAIAVGLQKLRRFMDPKVRALQYLRVMATDKDLAHTLTEDRLLMRVADLERLLSKVRLGGGTARRDKEHAKGRSTLSSVATMRSVA